MSSFLQDVRYALRMLGRQPAFTIVAVLTLALGIGGTTAVFTLVNGVLLRPLPYGDPDRLVLLLNGRNGRLSTAFSPPNYRDVTGGSGVFADSAAFNPTTANLTGQGDPQRLAGADVTPTFFSVLGVPILGRAFTQSDVAAGGQVLVISDGFWRRQLGARADAIGSAIRLDGKPYTVIGIAPPDVTLPNRPDYWRPLMLTPENLSDAQRGAQWLGVVARLKPGVDLRAAADAMAVVANRLSRDYPLTNRDRVISLTLLHDRIVHDVRPALLVVLAAVALVLLIGCVNVANLLLARACGRTREVAVRAALGASRARLVRQFLAETLVLGGAGCAGGLALAYWATRALVALGPESIPRLSAVTMDARVFIFAVTITVATSVMFGLVPALTATGGAFARLITSAARGSIGPAGSRVRKALVVCEMSLAVVLLIAAGLLMRSYRSISAVDPGFSPDHVLTFNLALPEAKYATTIAVHDLISTYVRRLGGSPGVERAAAVVGLPLENDFNISSSFTRPGEADSADSPSAGVRVVTPDYFRTLRIPLIAGRLFDAHDDERGAEVVLINQEAARRFWANQNPVGQQLRLSVNLIEGGRNGQKTIVGVVGDVKYGGLDLGAPPEIYLPYAQQPLESVTIAIRTRAEALSIVPTARVALAALDRELPLAQIRTMDDLVSRSTAQRRFTMLVLGLFAIVAVALASVGVYGVLAYLVTNRTQEIGVRLALGAAGGDVVRLFLREGAVLTSLGLVAGLAGALAAARGLRTLLFGVSATDPATFAGVAVLLVIIALAASYVPARRAARVEPMQALRMD